jgi:hypothetical protein
MKTLTLILSTLASLILLSSCEFDVATETTVNPDGSLDKTIAIEKKDSTKYLFNVNTWEKSVEKRNSAATPDSAKSLSGKEVKTFNTFHKKFASVEEVNAELSVVSDTVLQVTSKFEKKFRWFYTYITYSETYHKLNKMKLNPEDYFTREDYAFIDRLPAEGQKISKADERYFSSLHDKIFDEYGETALYDEYFELAFVIVTTQPGIDSLKKYRKHFRDALEKIDKKKDVSEDNFLLLALDSFKIAIDPAKVADFKKSQKNFFHKINFISSTSDGKFVNRINLPWRVVNTNADSVSGNSLFWAPPTMKFLLKDYTMYGECRKLNWWAVVVSVLIVGFTGYLFTRKRN